MQTVIHRMDKQQGPTVEHRELDSKSCDKPSWRRMLAQMVKTLPAMQETQVPSLGWEDSPGEGNGNPRQYSCLENPMDRGAWRATVHRVAKSQTQLKLVHKLYLNRSCL